MSAEKLKFRLTISLSWPDTPPEPGSRAIGVFRGGRETLLRWLETRLGLQRKPVAQVTRVVRYAARLQAERAESYKASLDADLWGTAQSLLAKRDGLRLLGWNGKEDGRLPTLVRDLVEDEASGNLPPAEADRLGYVLGALADGQRLPEHAVTLREPAAHWPAAWRPVLAKLTLHHEPNRPKAGPLPVTHFTWWRALSTVTAAEATAATLAKAGAEDVVILCEDAQLAGILDDALAARGVPTMGVADRARAHPVLQVLPLALGLMWSPADPERVLEFLLLPVGPIPSSWARRLAEALAERPGIGGEAWFRALGELSERDPEKSKEYLERVRLWISTPEGPSGTPLKQKAVANRCSWVAQWALKRAANAEEDLAAALSQLAAQAASLAELAMAFPRPISEPQLQRLTASVQEGGVSLGGRPAGAKGPRWISSLAELDGRVERLVWFGVHSSGGLDMPWSAADAAALTKAGLDIDFEARRHALKREAERAGLRRVTGPILAVQLATAADVPLHPLWIELDLAAHGKPVLIEDKLADGGGGKAWPLPAEERRLRAWPEPPAVWKVNADNLADRSTTSAGELETRLACPLRWTFEYAAKLRSSAIAQLPEGFLLRGNLSHDVLEEVFGREKPRSADEAARAAGEVFLQRAATEAADLARPAAARQRQEFKEQLERAARAFFEFLKRGRYEVVAFEFEPGGKLLGRDFRGRLDCVLKGKDGGHALVDLKYAGQKKYGELIQTGRAIQLAVYVASLAKDGTKPEDVAAGYFIVDRAHLWTPAEGGLAGAREGESVPDALGLAKVWKAFAAALKAGEGWLDSGEIPVRPLQAPEEWPPGAEIAMKEVDGSRYSNFSGQSVCQYCAYPRLCGMSPVS